MQEATSSKLTNAALGCGVAVPILYFGLQPLAAQFYPGYSFLTNSASQLGSDRSTLPAVLNTGAIVTGLIAIFAAYGFARALPRAGSPRFVAWLTALAVVSLGVAAIWAGSHPLPSARHNPGALGAGAFVLPVLLAAALWRSSGAVRVYLLINAALFFVLAPVMGNKTPIDVGQYYGLFQRIAAAVIYVPVGVAAAALLRMRRAERPDVHLS
jgi:hypothetical protein